MVFRTRGGDKRDRTADLLNAKAHLTVDIMEKFCFSAEFGIIGNIARNYWSEIQ